MNAWALDGSLNLRSLGSILAMRRGRKIAKVTIAQWDYDQLKKFGPQAGKPGTGDGAKSRLGSPLPSNREFELKAWSKLRVEEMHSLITTVDLKYSPRNQSP